jgi:hypothetical protein
MYVVKQAPTVLVLFSALYLRQMTALKAIQCHNIGQGDTKGTCITELECDLYAK